MRASIDQNQSGASPNSLDGKIPGVSAKTKAEVENLRDRASDTISNIIQENLNRYQSASPHVDTIRKGAEDHLKKTVTLEADSGFTVELGSKQIKAIELDKNFKAWTNATIENGGLENAAVGNIGLENIEGVVLKLREPQLFITQVDLKKASISKSDQPGKVNLYIEHSFGNKSGVVSANAPEVKLLRQIAQRLIDHKAGIVLPKPFDDVPRDSIAQTD